MPIPIEFIILAVMTTNNELGNAPLGKLMVRLSLPSITAFIINILYNVVDRIYIGHIPGSSSLPLTGLGICLPVIMLISAFSAFAGNGGAPLRPPAPRNSSGRRTSSAAPRKSQVPD